jgi:hypothetical protein
VAPHSRGYFLGTFIWIKAYLKNVENFKSGSLACANGRVDFEEWLAYKIQLHSKNFNLII